MSGRRSRRTRGEKPELVPPKSDEETAEDNDSDDKPNETTTRGRGRRGKRIGSSSSLSQLATASKKPASSRKKASAKAAATPKKRGRPRGRPRTRSPSPSESSISGSEEEEPEDEDNASENEASDAEESNDSNNEGSEEDDEEDDDDAERDTEDDAPKEALTGKKKSTRNSRKKKDDTAAVTAKKKDPPKKRRGRKPKAKAAAADDESSSESEEKPQKKKRGRKASQKADEEDESSSQTEKRPKKRGRPPKAKKAADSDDDDESSSAEKKPQKKRGRTSRSKQGDDSLATVGEKPQTKRGRKPKAKSANASADDSSSSSDEQPPKKRGRKPKAKPSASEKATEESDEEGSDHFSEDDLLPLSALATKKPPASSGRGRKAESAKDKAAPKTTPGPQKKAPKTSKLSKAAAKAKTAPITNFFSPKASGSAKDANKTAEDEDEKKAGNESAIVEEKVAPASEEIVTEKAEGNGKTIGDKKESSETTDEKVGEKDKETEPSSAATTRPTRKRKLTMKAAEAAATEPTKTEKKKEGTEDSEVAEKNSSTEEKASENEVVIEANSYDDNMSLEGHQGSVASEEGTTDLSKDQKGTGSIVEAAKSAAAATLAMFPLFSAKSKSTEENEKSQAEDTKVGDEKSENSDKDGDMIMKDENTQKASEAKSTVTDTASLDQDKAIDSSVQQQSSDEVDGTEPMEIDSTGKENGDTMDKESDPNDSIPSSLAEKANGDSTKENNVASEATSSPEVEEVSKSDSDIRKTSPDGPGSSQQDTMIPDASTEIIGETSKLKVKTTEEEGNIISESSSIKINGDMVGNETSQSSSEIVTSKEGETNDPESKDAATVGEAGSTEVKEKAVVLEAGEKNGDKETVTTEGNTGGADSQNSIEDKQASKQDMKDELVSQHSKEETTTESAQGDVSETAQEELAQEESAQTTVEVSQTEPLDVSANEKTESDSKELPDSTAIPNEEEEAEKSGSVGQAENGNGELSEGIKSNADVSEEPIQTEVRPLESTIEETSLKATEESGANVDSSVPLQPDDSQDGSPIADSGEKKSVMDNDEMEIDSSPGSSEKPLEETTQMDIDPAINVVDPNESSPEMATQEDKSKDAAEINTGEEDVTNADEVKVTPEKSDSTMDVEIPTEVLSESENELPSPKVEMKVSWVPLSKAPRQGKSIKDSNQFLGYDESKTNRVKMLLYTTGSKIHRGKGFERIFGMYWDAVCLRLSRPLNGNASKRCDQAISAFLKSKKLRKIHNKFVMSIMRRALKDRIPYSEVSENIPSRWEDRVKVPHVTSSRKPPKKKAKTFYDGLEEDLLQLSSVPHVDGTTPYKERWECPTDAVDEIYKNPQEGPSVPIASSCIPGALVVDPMIRGTVEAGGMKVTDNAMWLLTVALKEHIKNILNDSIEYKKGLRKGEIYPQAIHYPNVLASSSNKNRKISKGRTSSASLDNGRKKQINSIDLFAALNMLPSGQPSSIGGSVSRMSLEQTFLSGFNSIPSFDTGMGFKDVQGFISNTITEMAKTRLPEEKKAKAYNLKSSENSASKERPANAKIQQDSTKKTPNAIPTVRPQSLPLTSNTTPAAVQTPVMDSKAFEKKGDTATLTASITSQGGESRTAGVSGLKPVQQLAASANSGPPRFGAGRGAKNLAALMARATSESTTTSVSNDATQDSEKPNQINNNASTDVPVNTEPAKPNTDKATNEVAKTPVESKPNNVANLQSSSAATGDSKSQESAPSTQSAAPVRRGSGKGFGSKDLAAMRARSMASTEQTEEAAVSATAPATAPAIASATASATAPVTAPVTAPATAPATASKPAES